MHYAASKRAPVARLAAMSLAAGIWFGLAGQAQAQVPEVSVAVQLKILSADRGLEQRFAGKVVLGVLHPAGPSKGIRAVKAVCDHYAIRGAIPAVLEIAFTDSSALRSSLEKTGVTVLFIEPGLAAQVSDIVAVAHASGVPTMSFARADVQKGVAVAVSLDGGRPEISVNLASMRKVGMVLPAQLLRLAKVVKE